MSFLRKLLNAVSLKQMKALKDFVIQMSLLVLCKLKSKVMLKSCDFDIFTFLHEPWYLMLYYFRMYFWKWIQWLQWTVLELKQAQAFQIQQSLSAILNIDGMSHFLEFVKNWLNNDMLPPTNILFFTVVGNYVVSWCPTNE